MHAEQTNDDAGLRVSASTTGARVGARGSDRGVSATRQVRLHQLLELVQASRGWSRRKLARALGRNPSRLVPESGVPKLDLVVCIARLLDWSVSDVVGHVWAAGSDPGPRVEPEPPHPGWEGHSRRAGRAHRQGRFHEALAHARAAWASSSTATERALARNREVGAWDGMGCYLPALDAARSGLAETPVPSSVRRMLQANLANAYYGLSMLDEAHAVARHLLEGFAQRPAVTERDRRSHAFAAFVLGQTARRHFLAAPDPRLARDAHEALGRALRLLDGLATRLDDDALGGMANTVRGSLIEVDALRGQRREVDAVDALCAGLDAVVDCASCASGDWLESFGWWCISGCTIATGMLGRDPAAESFIAVFTNKADEIATHLDNWSIRERILSVQYVQAGVMERSPVLDDEDVRQIAGTMGRFPAFQDDGWQLLRSACVIARDGG